MLFAAMQMITKKWFVVSTIAGIAIYYCEWLELIFPGFCNQGLEFTIARMYAAPVLLAGILGFYFFEKPMKCWLLFMLPSWMVRTMLLFGTAAGGENLWPLLLMFDTGHLILVGMIIGGVAKLRNNARLKPPRKAKPF